MENCLVTSVMVEQEISAKELSQQIDRFLATLDEENQVMFVRRYWYNEELAAALFKFRFDEQEV